jgi:hypothetical protein
LYGFAVKITKRMPFIPDKKPGIKAELPVTDINTL